MEKVQHGETREEEVEKVVVRTQNVEKLQGKVKTHKVQKPKGK